MANELIIRKLNNVDLYDLEVEELFELKDTVVSNVNLKQLREAVNKAVMNLAQVGEPTWNADVEYIVADDQKRLNLIYMLMRNLEIFESGTSNMKKNKYGVAKDSEQILNYLIHTKELIDTVVNFGDFKQKEAYQNHLELQEHLERENRYFNAITNGNTLPEGEEE